MAAKTVQERSPTWFTRGIAAAVETGDISKIAQAAGDTIANSEEIRKAIKAGLEDKQPDLTGKPGAAHRIRFAITEAMRRG